MHDGIWQISCAHENLDRGCAGKVGHYLRGDLGLSDELAAQLVDISDPRERMVWYMTSLYDRCENGLFRTERPLRSGRVQAMLFDFNVAPKVRRGIRAGERRFARATNRVNSDQPLLSAM